MLITCRLQRIRIIASLDKEGLSTTIYIHSHMPESFYLTWLTPIYCITWVVGRALYRAKLECKVSNLFSKILYLNYAYKYTNVPNTITFNIWHLNCVWQRDPNVQNGGHLDDVPPSWFLVFSFWWFGGFGGLEIGLYFREKNQLGVRPFPTRSSKVALYSPVVGHHEIDLTFL